MKRRKLTLKRLDPWSVLKFGFVVNLVGLAILLVAARIVWFFIRRLELIESVCDTAGNLVLNVAECGIDGGALFRQVLLIGLLGVVVMTGVQVFGAFLYNLIADLTGGLTFSFLDDSVGSGEAMTARGGVAAPTGAGDPTIAREQRLRDAAERDRERTRTGRTDRVERDAAASAGAASAGAASAGAASTSTVRSAPASPSASTTPSVRDPRHQTGAGAPPTRPLPSSGERTVTGQRSQMEIRADRVRRQLEAGGDAPAPDRSGAGSAASSSPTPSAPRERADDSAAARPPQPASASTDTTRSIPQSGREETRRLDRAQEGSGAPDQGRARPTRRDGDDEDRPRPREGDDEPIFGER